MGLSHAVKITTAYAEYFEFPISPQEVFYWLITPRTVTFSSIKKYLRQLKPKELLIREKLKKNTAKKLKEVERLAKIVRFIPSIRLLAITGSTAMNNSKKGDDIDLLIVTSAHTLWLTRFLLLTILSLFFSRRHPGDSGAGAENAFCPNLWLDMETLSIPQNIRNIYTAHEVLQVKPVLDKGFTYKRFILRNSWTKKYLANAYSALSEEKTGLKNQKNLSFLLFPLNVILFLLQYLYMLPKKTTERVTLHSAFFHKNDLSGSLEERLSSVKP